MITKENKSNFAEILRKLSPLLEEGYIDMLAANFVWNLVLGVLPHEFKGIENKIMEQARKDTIQEKIDNIERLTFFAEYLCKVKPDYEYDNLESFSLSILQLIKYTAGDKKTEESIRCLKDLYITFMTSYFIQGVKNGTLKSVTKNIRYFSEKIFCENNDITVKLNDIISQ